MKRLLVVLGAIPIALSAWADNCHVVYQEDTKRGAKTNGVTVLDRCMKNASFVSHGVWLYQVRQIAFADSATGKNVKGALDIWTDGVFGFLRYGEAGFVELHYEADGKEYGLFDEAAPRCTILENDAPTARVRLDYSSPRLTGAFTFSYHVLDRKLILEVELSPKTRIGRYELRFFTPAPDAVIAGQRTLTPEKAQDDIALDPATEYRIIIDRKGPPRNGLVGPCALVAMPGQAQTCVVNVWQGQVRFAYGQNVPEKLTFLFYDQRKDRDPGLDYLKRIEVRRPNE